MISIKNFEMPENCHWCPFSDWTYDFCKCRALDKEFREPKDDKKYRYCPLHEDGCDVCEYKYRCSKRKGLVKAIIFGCKDFKKEEN